jgi:phosphoribosylformylglycinamidine synthase subunit PurS
VQGASRPVRACGAARTQASPPAVQGERRVVPAKAQGERRVVPPKGAAEVKLRVLVRLKPGIMDVQGTAVQRALVGLGFADLAELRIGKVIEMEIETSTAEHARARADEMCRRLLANPILEDYVIEAATDVAPSRAGGQPDRVDVRLR